MGQCLAPVLWFWSESIEHDAFDAFDAFGAFGVFKCAECASDGGRNNGADRAGAGALAQVRRAPLLFVSHVSPMLLVLTSSDKEKYGPQNFHPSTQLGQHGWVELSYNRLSLQNCCIHWCQISSTNKMCFQTRQLLLDNSVGEQCPHMGRPPIARQPRGYSLPLHKPWLQILSNPTRSYCDKAYNILQYFNHRQSIQHAMVCHSPGVLDRQRLVCRSTATQAPQGWRKSGTLLLRTIPANRMAALTFTGNCAWKVCKPFGLTQCALKLSFEPRCHSMQLELTWTDLM